MALENWMYNICYSGSTIEATLQFNGFHLMATKVNWSSSTLSIPNDHRWFFSRKDLTNPFLSLPCWLVTRKIFVEINYQCLRIRTFFSIFEWYLLRLFKSWFIEMNSLWSFFGILVYIDISELLVEDLIVVKDFFFTYTVRFLRALRVLCTFLGTVMFRDSYGYM